MTIRKSKQDFPLIEQIKKSVLNALVYLRYASDFFSSLNSIIIMSRTCSLLPKSDGLL